MRHEDRQATLRLIEDALRDSFDPCAPDFSRSAQVIFDALDAVTLGAAGAHDATTDAPVPSFLEMMADYAEAEDDRQGSRSNPHTGSEALPAGAHDATTDGEANPSPDSFTGQNPAEDR